MARKQHQDFVEARVEALEEAADLAPASRLVFWVVVAAFSSLLFSWVNAL